jgi:hypothetical protein
VAVGDRADRVPVRAVADQVRREDRARLGPDRRLDPRDVDLVGVGLDVDEHGHEPGRTIGAMSVENVSGEVTISAPRGRSSSSTAR